MVYKKVNFPLVRNIYAQTIADDIIGIRPDETWDEAVNRFILEKRLKKLIYIKEKIKKRKGG